MINIFKNTVFAIVLAISIQGIAQQELMANAANTQLSNTLAGNYLNPFCINLIYFSYKIRWDRICSI